MDPNVAWRDLSKAVATEDWDTAAEIAGELAGWMERGGFPPSISGHRRFDSIVAKNACQAIVAWEVY